MIIKVFLQGISAGIVRNAGSEDPDVLTVVYIPDVSKYGDLVCSGLTDTAHVSGLCPRFGSTVFDGGGMDISFGFILDDMRLLRADYLQICSYVRKFADQVHIYEGGLDADNYFVRYDISPLEVLRVLVRYIHSGECVVCGKYGGGVFGFRKVLHRAVSDVGCSELFGAMVRDIEGRSVESDSYFALAGALVVVSYWGVSVDELVDICHNCHSAAGGDRGVFLLPYVVKSFGYNEYLDRHLAGIEGQFNNFAEVVRECLGISYVNLLCLVDVPVNSSSQVRNRYSAGELCGVGVTHTGGSCVVPEFYYDVVAYGYVSERLIGSSR